MDISDALLYIAAALSAITLVGLAALLIEAVVNLYRRLRRSL